MLTIVVLIIAGIGIILFGFGNGGHAIGFSNIWEKWRLFFTGGFKGFFFALSIVIGAYQGVELIGITAGEAEKSAKTITHAVKSTVWRILIFLYRCDLCHCNRLPLGPAQSNWQPIRFGFFAKIGITAAAGIINFVVITAAMSGCNSGIFSATRMLYTLAKKMDRHQRFFCQIIGK
ncbi:hypothetical protein GCM10020331_003990 [Ectobacillus funiculus]